MEKKFINQQLFTHMFITIYNVLLAYLKNNGLSFSLFHVPSVCFGQQMTELSSMYSYLKGISGKQSPGRLLIIFIHLHKIAFWFS